MLLMSRYRPALNYFEGADRSGVSGELVSPTLHFQLELFWGSLYRGKSNTNLVWLELIWRGLMGDS